MFLTIFILRLVESAGVESTDTEGLTVCEKAATQISLEGKMVDGNNQVWKEI